MSDDHAQDAGQNETQDDRPEYLKFVALLVVLLVIVLAMALVVPPFFKQVVPAVLGLDRAPSSESVPALGDTELAPESGLGGVPPATEVAGLLHTVQEGETLQEIAVAYGISLEALAAANNLINPQQIKAGTVLVIPASE